MPLHLETARAKQARLVLCPGDPDRVRLVARDLLDGAEVVTEARGLVGVTGLFDGVRVTVQATGMGGGSTGIVVNELIELGARVLIRAGTAGGLQRHLRSGDLVVAETVVADDGAGLAMAGTVPQSLDGEVTSTLDEVARTTGRRTHRGPVVSTDLFYDLEPGRNEAWEARGLLAVEMEAAVIASVAARHGARAGCVLAVSNTLVGPDTGWVGVRERQAAAMDACRAGLEALTRSA